MTLDILVSKSLLLLPIRLKCVWSSYVRAASAAAAWFPNRSSSLSLSGFKIFRHFLFRLNFTKTWVWSAIWFIASIIVQVTTLWVLLFFGLQTTCVCGREKSVSFFSRSRGRVTNGWSTVNQFFLYLFFFTTPHASFMSYIDDIGVFTILQSSLATW